MLFDVWVDFGIDWFFRARGIIEIFISVGFQELIIYFRKLCIMN